MRDFMRIALERDPRSLAFLDEVRAGPARPTRPGRRPAPLTRRFHVVFDSGTDRDRHALERLETDMIGWLTTVTPDGPAADLPDLVPVGRTARPSSTATAGRSATRTSRPTRGSRLHLNDNGAGGDVVIVEGEARVDDGDAAGPRQRRVPRQVRRLDRRAPRIGRGDGDDLQRPAPDPPDARPGVRRVSRRRGRRWSRPARRSGRSRSPGRRWTRLVARIEDRMNPLLAAARAPPVSDRARGAPRDAPGRRPPRGLAAVGAATCSSAGRPGRTWTSRASSRATSRSRSSRWRSRRRAASTSSATRTRATRSSSSRSRSAGRLRRGAGCCPASCTWPPGRDGFAARSGGAFRIVRSRRGPRRATSRPAPPTRRSRPACSRSRARTRSTTTRPTWTSSRTPASG